MKLRTVAMTGADGAALGYAGAVALLVLWPAHGLDKVERWLVRLVPGHVLAKSVADARRRTRSDRVPASYPAEGAISAVADIEAARDAAQQMVSSVLLGDTDTAGDIAGESAHPRTLALILAELTAYVHNRWSCATGVDQRQVWAELMVDVETWRARRRETP